MSVYEIKYGLYSKGICWLMIWSFLESCSFTAKTCRALLEESARQPYDLVVVPGVPFENKEWDRTMKGRIYWSKYLFDRGIARNILYSGSSVYSPYYEGKIMALYALALGVDPGHIFIETRAEHSTENIYYGYRKGRKLGFRRIALASDPFQTKMLQGFIRKKLGPEVGLIPMVVDTLKKIENQMNDPVIDYQEAYNENFTSLKKRESLWKRWRGTRGLNIDTTAYH